jgi:formate hydrogenlyase subunit 3/multisubunit Na+/H+ antiporter MnhD subunit
MNHLLSTLLLHTIKNTERRKGEAVVVPIYHFFSMHAYVILDDLLLLYFLFESILLAKLSLTSRKGKT